MPNPGSGSSRSRRRRHRVAGGVAGLAVLTLVACAPDNTPTSYNDVAESSFMQSCTGDAPEYDGTTTTLAGSDYCACAYQVFVQNVPYNDEDKTNRVDDDGEAVFAGYEGKTYLEYNSEMKTDPDVLSDDIVAKLDDCATSPESLGTGGTTPRGTAPEAPPGTATES